MTNSSSKDIIANLTAEYPGHNPYNTTSFDTTLSVEGISAREIVSITYRMYRSIHFNQIPGSTTLPSNRRMGLAMDRNKRRSQHLAKSDPVSRLQHDFSSQILFMGH
jgi:hypothetical protein